MRARRGLLQRPLFWSAAAAAVSITLLGGAAIGSTFSGSGSTGKVDFKTSNVRIETPSSTYQNVTSMNITTGIGPLVVRFDAQAYVDDYNSGGNFDGSHYAATLVRVLLDGAIVPPGPAVRFTTNEGKRNINDLSGQSASFSWATTVSSGAHTVKVQFRSVTTYDISGFVRWTLTADHA
jgi:hypothetical protein